MKSIYSIIILAKRAEFFNHALGLSWQKSKTIFRQQDRERLQKWFQKNESQIRAARKFNLFWDKNTLVLDQGQRINPFAVLNKLEELNYNKNNFVASPGDYAHRGEIIDIYPMNYEMPIRIEFFGNYIETIYFLSKEEIQAENEKMRIQFSRQDLLNLKKGNYIVHLDHGIGRFHGMLTRQGKKYYEIEYAAHDILLVPEGLEKKLSPYLGFIEPKLTRLGGMTWQRTKKRVKEDVLKFAKELLSIYAQRKIAYRPPYQSFPEREKQIDSSFDYELTRDQKETWQQINQDLSAEKPMDRLICGDVGFGKTEIALRAAFRVMLNAKQVALITPTTILADQHFHTFKTRLKDFPFKIRMLTRLIPLREQKTILKELQDNKVAILVGTHRLLSRDIQFNNLGLLIIDEEQRFGVRQKEKLKKIRNNIDVLSLSATPIPRTLHMALANIKDISLIMTPPFYKKSIQTFIGRFNFETLKKAILSEIKRQGQVYYLHNRIGTLTATQEKLKKILPKIRFGALHGRMPEKKIVQTIHRFREKKIDVLITTSIIENGLDLKNVNTLIVEDATRLGLAQAHQIRGRIGRGERQSYAYFFYPQHSVSALVKKRLNALKKFSYLGAGYQLALKDLEIRGAGNILGKEQSGAINRVGLNLYYQILNQAIEKLKAGREFQ